MPKTVSYFILSALLSLITVANLAAQDEPDKFARDAANDISTLSQAERTDDALFNRIGPGASNIVDEIRDRLVRRDLKRAVGGIDFLQLGESASQAIKNSGSPLSSAGTSLVTKTISSILGLAEEAGAVSSSSSGSATTLTANIPQIIRLLNANSKPCYVISDNCAWGNKLIEGASASFSFNTSSSTMPNGPSFSTAALAGLTGTQTPVFAGFSFHQTLHGRKNQNVTHKDFEQTLQDLAKQSEADRFAKITHSLQVIYDKDGGANGSVGVQSRCFDVIRTSTKIGDELAVQVDACIDILVDSFATIGDTKDLVNQFTQAETAYFKIRDLALEKMFYRNTFSLEYDLINNLNQPMTSTFKSMYGYQSKSGNLQTTINGSATLYNSLRGSSESRIRSAQAAMQLDYSPATKPALEAVYSGGYYFQYMVANGLIDLPSTAFAPGTTIPLPDNASVLLNTTGPIHIGQGKITLKVKGKSISIPLALTVSSRTDLIKANRVSGNFGISYDFSSLLAK